MPIWRSIKIATVEQLQEMMTRARMHEKHVVLEVSPGIWINADAFQKKGNVIQFSFKGHVSGFVRMDFFDDIKWGEPLKNPKHEQEVPL